MVYVSRLPRHHQSDALYHVVSRGVARTDIFTTDSERVSFIGTMREVFRLHGIRLFSYCLMSNHFHLLLAVGKTPLGAPMQSLLTRHAINFNRTHDRTGHLFQDRYKASDIRNDRHLVRSAAYIHLNPVRAGLVTRPEDWPWSSYQDFSTGTTDTLNLTDIDTVTGWNLASLRESHRDCIQEMMSPADDLSELVEKAALTAGVEVAALRAGAKGAAFTLARRLVVKWAEGHSLASLARELNCSRAALSQLLHSM